MNIGSVHVVFRASRGRSGCRCPAEDRSRPEELRRSIEQEVRYANIIIIEGNQASQFGIDMVSARIAEIGVRGERAVIPIGLYGP